MAADSQSPGVALVSDAEGSAAERESQVRQALATLVENHGRGIYDEPARCDAMLRDLCPGCRREVFLVVAALKERVVADLLLFAGSTPDEVLIARNSRKLEDGLGLSETSARWAVESWLTPAQALATMPPRPAAALGPPQFDLGEIAAGSGGRRIDWRWLGLCVGAIACASLAAAAVGYCSLFHGWQSLVEWLAETAGFAGALALSAFGLKMVSRRLMDAPAPQHQALDPNRTAAALLVEVLVLLVLPAVPVGGAALWAGEWIYGLHIAGRNHDLAFHLGRILQSLILIAFLYRWVRSMVAVQGAIASSMVRSR